jgi:predicted ABC-type ATPase
MAGGRPIFIVIAGPNGAGKTSLYERQISKDFPDAEFINADRLAQERFGHPAVTKEESEVGQQLAESRRRELMAQRKPMVCESTFSHESKVDLVRDAKAAGYAVLLYHVNVRNADLAVMRVESRVGKGGHPVPEEKTRGRYERNQPLIREAALLADHAYIYDNSELGKPHRLALQLHQGKALNPDNVPPWARQLYGKELEAFAPTQVNSPAASFAAAAALTKAQLGDEAQTFISRAGSTYTGPVIGKTDAHTVQQIGPASTVAHFTSKLDQQVDVGDRLTVEYSKQRGGKAEVVREQSAGATAANKAKADAFRTMEPKDAVKRYPDLAGAYAALRVTELKASAENPKQTARIVAALQAKLATRIERGQSLPEISLKEPEQSASSKRDVSRGR